MYQIILEKEYYNIPKCNKFIGLVMMVKNEEKTLNTTLNSVLNHVKALIIYDTGSTDSTIEIVKKFSEKHKINLYLIQGEFVNFCISRNVVLDYAEKINVEYLLLMDSNDCLINGEELNKLAKTYDEQTVFLICQEWFTRGGNTDKYYNTRFFRNRTGWRYKGAVHEWLYHEKAGEDNYLPVRLPDTIILRQDRTEDNLKSAKRFSRDYEILIEEHKKDPLEPRTLFYLAQTCMCLQKYDEAIYYSKLRLELQGFYEERFHSYMRIAEVMVKLAHPWDFVLPYYMKAFSEFNRVEPLCKLAEYYITQKMWNSAFMFLRMACDLNYPHECNLFVDRSMYDYYRWHLMGLCAHKVNRYEEGKKACEIAIEAKNLQIDKANMEFYNVKKTDSKESSIKNVTKEEFLKLMLKELRAKYPRMTTTALTKIAEERWKNR